MFLILYFLLIIASNVLGMKYGIVHFHDIPFTLGLFLSGPLFFLRDLLQEFGAGFKPVLATLAAYFVLYFVAGHYVADPWHRTYAATISFIWAMLVSRNVYTWFRRFGWAPASIIANVVATPFLTVFFWYLYYGTWLIPWGQLPLKYLTMALMYGIILTLVPLEKWIHHPKLIRVPRDKWFKFYD